MFQDFVESLGKLFTRRCKSCEAKDMFIQSLREELREERLLRNELIESSQSINKHLLHMNEHTVESSGEQRSLKPKLFSISSKIRAAEVKSASESNEVIEQRKKAYQDRIDNITAPKEVEH